MKHEQWWLSPEWWLAGLTFALAFLTWRLVVQTRRLVNEAIRTSERQAAEMQSSLEVSRLAAQAAKTSADAFQVAQRAWVSFETILPPVENSGTINGEKAQWTEFQISWRNAGTTPAIRCRFIVHGDVLPVNADVPNFAIPLDAGPTATLLPGVSLPGRPYPLRSSALEDLKVRKVNFYLYARVDYEDVFAPGVPRHTEVTFQVTVQGYSGKNVPRLAYALVGAQNSSS